MLIMKVPDTMADGIIGGIGTGKSFTKPRYGNVAGLFLKNTPGLNETSGQSMKDFAKASFRQKPLVS